MVLEPKLEKILILMKKNLAKWDYVFICSNKPAPRSIEKCKAAIDAGKHLVIVYLERPDCLLQLSQINSCDIRPFPVNFRKLEPKRLIDMFRFYRWLKTRILSLATKDCELYVDSLDLLAVATLAGKGQRTFRYEVRDLNSAQIEATFLSLFIKNIESFLLKRVDKLILTSTEYYQQYYKHIYHNQYEVVENYPNINFWYDFTRKKRENEFVIGYVGVIRYLPCLKTLIEATKILREKECNIVLKFAGGGAVEELKEFAGTPSWIEYLGAYDNNTIKAIYQDVDLSFSVYDTAVKNVLYAMPNKFYESILNGIPILVAKGTFLEKRVKEIGIGTSSDSYDVNEMAEILLEAYYNDGWFRKAKTALKKIKKITQEEYDKTITKALIG